MSIKICKQFISWKSYSHIELFWQRCNSDLRHSYVYLFCTEFFIVFIVYLLSVTLIWYWLGFKILYIHQLLYELFESNTLPFYPFM